MTRLVQLADSMDIKTLQDLARHKHIATTMKHYVRSQEAAKRKAVDVLCMDAIG